jgi:glycogenin glucosyltransferase
VAPIVQYHTKGEFQPVVPIVSSSQAYQPEETESEIIHTAAEQPLHEIAEISKEVEAYVPLADTNVEKEQREHYSAWDASRLVRFPPF